ncbi:MAG: FAD-dependent oxidoreductase [Dehalococcoidales bacterium]|nr:FAD-dependent oxidoreductase [Dehalococcoidales bacterium]
MPYYTRDSFEMEPPPIPPEEIVETSAADVVVVGAGTSGKAAALSAAESGASVIQIDKHTTYRWSGGLVAAINSRLQKKLGVKIDKDEVILALMQWAGNRPDQRLYRLWADNSGAVLDWLMDITDAEGVKTLPYQWPRKPDFDPEKEYYPDFPVGHMHSDGKTIGLYHKCALDCVEKRARELGVEIRYRTRGLRLIREGNGRVAGVFARNPEGQYIQLNARKAVVLCTGDYANNPAMVQKYCPDSAEVARKNNIYMIRNEDLRLAPEPLNVGDGHLMAMWAGAVMEPGPHAPMSHATVGPTGANAFLRVNIEGERFENEDVPAQSSANSLIRQPGKKVWQVFDSKWEDELPLMGVGLGTFIEANDMIRQMLDEMTVRADTIEELAKKMNVPAKVFRATIDRYNELARAGKDLDFGKRPDRLTTVDKPPFYAGIIEQHILVILGGLIVNTRLQPLDAGRKVIPGLYLAGNTVGQRFAVDYPTMCAGLSHGFAWTTGRLAGLSAAAEKVHS